MFTLHSFLPLLEGFYEKLFPDSQSASKIIQVGSMRSDLHAIAVKIFQFYVSNGIELELQGVRSKFLNIYILTCFSKRDRMLRYSIYSLVKLRYIYDVFR